ncbi:MAG: squalene synthase HpnC [Planctomycetota bacterium]
MTLEDARRQTRALATSTYENFVVASWLLPKRYRQPFYDIYAYCRTADDIADESPTAEAALEGLGDFRRRVATIFGKRPGKSHEDDESNPIFVALAATIDEFNLPREPFEDLLHAFEQDQTVHRYDSADDLEDYCAHSANPVGRMVLGLADALTASNTVLSDEICTALQLANFWQDMRRDYQRGRLYLPQDVMEASGFDETVIADGVASASTPPCVRRAIAQQCEQTRSRFHQGIALADHVPAWLASDIRLFVHGGLATLDAIAATDFDVLARRVEVRRRTQIRLMIAASIGWL